MFSELQRTVAGTTLQAGVQLQHHQITIRCSDGNPIKILDSCGGQSITSQSTVTAVCAGLIVRTQHVLLYHNASKHI